MAGKTQACRGELREPGGDLHQDHFGSVTMVTDGAGNVVSGGSMGGKANYLYRPYGEIDRMNSSGPDITKFKYTVDANSVQGMNQYMYTEGNPVNFRDPSGRISAKGFMQDVGKAMLMNAVSTVSKDSLTMGFALNAWGNKQLFKMRSHKGIRNDGLKVLNAVANPLRQVGMLWGALNYAAGAITLQHPSIKYVDGGVVVQGGGLMPTHSGITLGNVAVTGGHDRETLKHESAHIQQFNEKGHIDYYSHLASSPLNNLTGAKESTYENDANRRAGTWGAYQAKKNYVEELPTFIILKRNYNLWNELNLFMFFYDRGY